MKPWVAHAVMLMNTKNGSTNANPRNTLTIMAPFSLSQPESARKPAPKNSAAERTTLKRYGEEQGHHYGATHPGRVLMLAVMGDVANHAVLHAEPGEDLQPVDERDARGVETVELHAEQAGEHGLGRERE